MHCSFLHLLDVVQVGNSAPTMYMPCRVHHMQFANVKWTSFKFNLSRGTFSPNCRCILYFSIVIELLLLKHLGSIRCEFGVNFSMKLGGPHHSAKFMNLA